MIKRINLAALGMIVTGLMIGGPNDREASGQLDKSVNHDARCALGRYQLMIHDRDRDIDRNPETVEGEGAFCGATKVCSKSAPTTNGAIWGS